MYAELPRQLGVSVADLTSVHLNSTDTIPDAVFSFSYEQFSFLLQVKMWVQLLIPRIEDGNNFGVSIQEETVAELRTVEGEAASYLDQISRFVGVINWCQIRSIT